jgi:NADPH:quinone reductase-like Zn-dependent oxidoreductase
MIRAMVTFMGRSQEMAWFVASVIQEDLDHLKDLVEEGKLTTVIDRRYTLSEVPDAFRYLGEGHAKGKLIVTV